jgi:hypothetical protein
MLKVIVSPIFARLGEHSKVISLQRIGVGVAVSVGVGLGVGVKVGAIIQQQVPDRQS